MQVEKTTSYHQLGLVLNKERNATPSPPCLFSSASLFADNPLFLGGTGASSPHRRTVAFLISAMENPEGTVKITHVFESQPFFFMFVL